VEKVPCAARLLGGKDGFQGKKKPATS